jgi:hypothetical protein
MQRGVDEENGRDHSRGAAMTLKDVEYIFMCAALSALLTLFFGVS